MKEAYQRTDRNYEAALEQVRPEELMSFFQEYDQELLKGPGLFSSYMRAKFREKRILQQNVFLAADISENYGYKIISEEKHTVNRDIILRICLAAHFDVEETQEALVLYGMAPLHKRIPRDIIFLTAIRNKIYDIYQVNGYMIQCGQIPIV